MSNAGTRVGCLLLAGLSCGTMRAGGPTPAVAPVDVGRVAPVPKEVREALDLSPFYKKYTDADGFPVLSSDKVSDAALLEAADVVHHMLDGRDDVRRRSSRTRCAWPSWRRTSRRRTCRNTAT